MAENRNNDHPRGGPDPGLLKYVLFSGNSVVFNEYGTSSATSYGHANATHAASIAAGPPARSSPISTANARAGTTVIARSRRRSRRCRR